MEISEDGESNQIFDLAIQLTILGLFRKEILYLKKTFKDIKRYIRTV